MPIDLVAALVRAATSTLDTVIVRHKTAAQALHLPQRLCSSIKLNPELDPTVENRGWTSLFFAASSGHLDPTRLLLAAKANAHVHPNGRGEPSPGGRGS